MTGASLDPEFVRRLVVAALLEDAAGRDVTTAALVPDGQLGRAVIIAKGSGMVAGLPLAEATFAAVDAALRSAALVAEGARIAPGDRVAAIEGPLAAVLRGERVALNFLCHLSGVATATAAVVEAIKGTRCRLRDTRKTLPGLRALQKYAVRVGGGESHRGSLEEAVLIKDNHLAAMLSRDLDIGAAVHAAREANPGLRLEIEVTSVDEARQGMDAGADELLLDNMSLAEMQDVVALAAMRDRRPALEASGGITLENARAVALTGVDYISMGAITHSVQALDMSLEVEV